MLSVLSAMMLTGCAATRSIATSPEALCAPWRAISYSGQRDSAQTVRQVRVHNATGRNLGCWQ